MKEIMEMYSSALNSVVSIGIIVPAVVEKIFIMLHGYKDRFCDMDGKLPLQEFADRKNMIIISPDTDDGYYISKKAYDINEFITDELISCIKAKYRLPNVPIHIAGISMGGYGSLLIGANFHNIFKSIISISGAFIAQDVAIGNPQVVGTDIDSLTYYTKTFAPFETLEEDAMRNPVKAAVTFLGRNNNAPLVILTCGTEDPLYERNMKAVSAMLGNNIKINWMAIKNGKHDYFSFEKGIRYAIEFID